MDKKKKRIIIAIVLLFCIAVTTTIVLIIQNPRRTQENQLADNGDIPIEEQMGDINAGHNNSEDVSLSSNIAEGKTELEEGKPSATQTSTEEAKKPTTESGNTADDNKPTGGTSGTTTQSGTTQSGTTQSGTTQTSTAQTSTTQTSTTQTSATQTSTAQTPTTQTPTTQTPSTTGQSSGGNQGGGNGGNTHQHTWEAQYRTVHHDEVGHWDEVHKEAYYEPVYKNHQVCTYCGLDFTETGENVVSHCANCGPPLSKDDPRYISGVVTNEGSGNGIKQVQVDTIHHEAVNEKKWIVDKKAEDEKVLDGYKCTTCGATK